MTGRKNSDPPVNRTFLFTPQLARWPCIPSDVDYPMNSKPIGRSGHDRDGVPPRPIVTNNVVIPKYRRSSLQTPYVSP